MKTICPICDQRRAKRRCWRQNMEEICPLCCAAKRDAECDDCPHYSEAQKYESARRPVAVTPDKDFLIELNRALEINPDYEPAKSNRVAV